MTNEKNKMGQHANEISQYMQLSDLELFRITTTLFLIFITFDQF